MIGARGASSSRHPGPRVAFGRGAAFALLGAFAAGAASACPDAEPSTGVVVGVTTTLHAGTDFTELSYEMKRNGGVTRSEKIPITGSTFPLELPFTDLSDGDSIEVSLHALLMGSSILDRTQRTTAIGGSNLLLRVPLDRSCITGVGPACTGEETCSAGQCVDVFVDPRKLPAYSSDWGKSTSDDPCKPVDQAPVIEIGRGQSDYLPVNDGDVLDVEAGPQGGFHVWLAIRMKGLRQSSSVTTITGTMPALDYDVAPYSVVFTFDPAEGGFCKIYGLRFRLDDPDHPIDTLLGKEVDVTVKVTDTDGAVGTGTKKIMLSDTVH